MLVGKNVCCDIPAWYRVLPSATFIVLAHIFLHIISLSLKSTQDTDTDLVTSNPVSTSATLSPLAIYVWRACTWELAWYTSCTVCACQGQNWLVFVGCIYRSKGRGSFEVGGVQSMLGTGMLRILFQNVQIWESVCLAAGRVHRISKPSKQNTDPRSLK